MYPPSMVEFMLCTYPALCCQARTIDACHIVSYCNHRNIYKDQNVCQIANPLHLFILEFPLLGEIRHPYFAIIIHFDVILFYPACTAAA